jgi:hypothetical protein
MKTNLKTVLTLIAVIIGIQGIRAEEEIRHVSAFSEISLRFPATVHLSQGKKQSVRIVARGSDLENIITEVKGRELIIRTTGKNIRKNFTREETDIFITVPEIDALSVAGSGSVVNEGEINARIIDLSLSGEGSMTLNGLKSERVKASVSGSGDMSLSASQRAVDLNVSISGSGSFQGINFPVDDVNVKISGSGSAFVYPGKSLRVRTIGSGDVTYRGNPAVDQSSIGSGKVVEYKK